MQRTGKRYFLGGVGVGAVAAGAILVVMGLLLADDGAATFPGAATATSSSVVFTGDGSEGAVVYQTHCARCHEAGAAEPGPPLRDLVDPSENNIRLVVLNGADMMPGFEDTLTPAEVDAVVGYALSGL